MEPQSPPQAPSPRRRRWPRRVAFVLLGLLALLVLLLGGALLYVNSSSGEERIRNLVVEGANGALQGKLGWESLEVQGDRFVFRGLKLFDPEGKLVAEIERVEVELAFRALLRKRLVISEALLFRPRLYLVQDERGLNLSRAIASRNPSTEETATGGEVFVQVDSLVMEQGHLDFVQQGEEADLHLQFDGLTAQGDATYATAGQRIEANLELAGRSIHPVEGPLSSRVGVKLAGLNGGGDLRVELPGLVLDSHADLKGLASGHLTLRELKLSPQTARAFVPSYPVKAPVGVTGEVEKQGDQLKFTLEGTAGSGTLGARGTADLATLRSEGITLTGRGLNLEELMDNAPSTQLSVDLFAKGGGTSLETLDGELTLQIPPSRVEGEPLGPIHLEASARGGRFQVPRLSAVLPGVQLRASGGGTLDQLTARGTLQVSDLSRLGKTLGRIGQAQPPELSGSGSLNFSVSGPASAPGVKLDGAFPTLRYQDSSLRELTVEAQIPDLTRPLDSEGTLGVSYLSAGDRVFRNLRAQVRSRAQEFRLDLVTGGAIDLHLLAVGTRDPDSRGMSLNTLTLDYPEASWSLTQPARLGFREEEVRIQGLQLRADRQLLAVDGSLRGQRVEAQIQLEQFDLGRIPKIAVDPSLALAGRVDLQLSARGTLKSPTAEGTLQLTDGGFKDYRKLGLSLTGAYAKDRATGQLSAQSEIANLRATFEVPVQGLLRRRNDPLLLTLDVEETALQPALKALGRPETAQGRAGAQLVLTGSAREPLLALHLWGREIRINEYPPRPLENADFDLRMQSALEDRVNAQIDLSSLGVSGRIDLRTPFTLGEVMAKPPTAEQLMITPVELDIALLRVPLRLLAAAGAPRLGGYAQVRAEVRGTARAPTVNAQVEVHQAGMRGATPLDGSLTLVADDQRIELGMEAHRADRKLLEVVAAISAPLARLFEGRALGEIPLQMKGVLHPLSLSELQPKPRDEEEQAKQASGVVLARWDAAGTLDAPRLSVRSNLEEVRVGKACIGRAAIAYDYLDTRSDLNLDLVSLGEGTLKLKATTKIPLGYSALQRGVEYQSAPITADLQARNFELGSFSGLIPKVRAIAGLLEADAHLEGTVTKPVVRGDVEWKNGKLALEGYGDFSEAHLLAHASNDRLHLEELKAKSGAGSLRLVLDARRQGQSGNFSLQGKTELSRFPLVVDDQLMAILTTNVDLSGEASSSLVNIRQLNIPEAHVELPEILGGKDLQELDRPNDVIFVRNGRPLRRRRAPAAAPAPEAPVAEAADAFAPTARPTPTPTPTPVARVSPVEPGAAPATPSTQFWITINAPRNLWVKGADINAELGLSEGFRVEYEDAAAIYGEVRFLRGDVDVLGRKFKVQRQSQVRFTGPAKTPYLNLTAVHENEREEVTVFVTIRGQGKEIAQGLKVSSQPVLPETEIFTLLATGRRTLKRGSGSSMNTGDAASIVGALAASTLKRTLSNKLPLDVFTIESTGEGVTGARIEAGTYITDKWYMGYTQRVGGAEEGENSYGVKVEYQVTPSISVEGEYGDQRKGADLIWSRDY